ncbi:NrfD/PsrC family molybdoenzyme membrane anchor subunit [Enhygromyxa salina]|uniref:Polysulfide reductase, NrfD n=1 Tax=Enhygromyxa salina TaxID=215803 RepID=A0A2S9YP99_9BACT|nr:NrfD/PsrC family molybdoenzyme membrane anchor subunit [Enhygromyxa salina]PRQ06914.1 Polysulfide reductase, NrfD [Enhygromyxa salina]
MSTITAAITGWVRDPQRKLAWRVAMGIASLGVLVLFVAIGWLFVAGVGVWGVGSPVSWGIAISSFVWWIGIGHAGTLISAILLLCRQRWRNPINRFAEAMTLVAIVCAAMYPLLHLGRPEYFYWLIPYPSTYAYWPQFRSPLVWDMFAIGTYGVVSLAFWYLGLIPDLATMRDRATGRRARVWALLALGWRGSATQWFHHRQAYNLLAGLATALVVSVHSVVSFDFAVTLLPGWHSTVFPVYFVAGALYSGMTMLLILLIPLRAWFGLHDFVRPRHIELCARLVLVAGLFTAYGYFAEQLFGWYAGDLSSVALVRSHSFGHSAPLYWTVIALNVGLLQLLWVARVRRNTWALFSIAVGINVGMWLERYLIVIDSLERGFLPSGWGEYTATIWDWATLLGSFGLFAAFMLLFIRFVPMISMTEMRELLVEDDGDAG